MRTEQPETEAKPAPRSWSLEVLGIKEVPEQRLAEGRRGQAF